MLLLPICCKKQKKNSLFSNQRHEISPSLIEIHSVIKVYFCHKHPNIYNFSFMILVRMSSFCFSLDYELMAVDSLNADSDGILVV